MERMGDESRDFTGGGGSALVLENRRDAGFYTLIPKLQNIPLYIVSKQTTSRNSLMCHELCEFNFRIFL